MAYDPNPLYELKKQASNFDGPRMYKSQASMSPIMGWYEAEIKKKREGKFNEIDEAQLKAALMGVKNKWYKIALSNKELIVEFFDCLLTKKKDYPKAKKIWLELLEKNKTNEANKFSTRTKVQPTVAPEPNPGPQSAFIDAGGVKANPSIVRGSDGLLEARSACVYLEEIGLAHREGEY